MFWVNGSKLYANHCGTPGTPLLNLYLLARFQTSESLLILFQQFTKIWHCAPRLEKTIKNGDVIFLGQSQKNEYISEK